MGLTEPLFGSRDANITGVESRTLRAALNLERRHVVAYANAMGLADRIVTMAVLTNWERSKGRGYPPPLVRGLSQLEQALWLMASDLATTAKQAPGTALVRRPLGARRIHQMLSRLYVFRPAELEGLDEGGGDFFQALADAAVARACLQLRDEGLEARVVFDQDPNEGIAANVGSGGLQPGVPFRASRSTPITHLDVAGRGFVLDPPALLDSGEIYTLTIADGRPVFVRTAKTLRIRTDAEAGRWATYLADLEGAHSLELVDTRQQARQRAQASGRRFGQVQSDGRAVTEDGVVATPQRTLEQIKAVLGAVIVDLHGKGLRPCHVMLGSPDADAWADGLAPGRQLLPPAPFYGALDVYEDEGEVRSHVLVQGPPGSNGRVYF